MNKYSILSIGLAWLLAMSWATAGEPEVDAPETSSHCCVAQQGGHDHEAHHDDMMEPGHCAERSSAAEHEAEAHDQEHEATGTGNQRQTRPSNVTRKHHHRR